MLHIFTTSARPSARRVVVRAAGALALASGVAAVTGRPAAACPAPRTAATHSAASTRTAVELVRDDLRANGYRADRLHVMSGFRTPQYNAGGGDPRGRAELSRHQYGDAADVWVENGTGTMADGDGRVDARDAAVLAAAAERVEQAPPDFARGVGIYRGNGAHGPFVHVDTRGRRARWGTG